MAPVIGAAGDDKVLFQPDDLRSDVKTTGL
jgi:hypothetical protein